MFSLVGKVFFCGLNPFTKGHAKLWRTLDYVEWFFIFVACGIFWWFAIWGTLELIDVDFGQADWWFLWAMVSIDIGCYLTGVWWLMVIAGCFMAGGMGGHGIQTMNETALKNRLVYPRKWYNPRYGSGTGHDDMADFAGDRD